MKELPLELKFKDIKDSIIFIVNKAITEYKLPYVLIESILSDVTNQCSFSAQKEINELLKSYKEEENK